MHLSAVGIMLVSVALIGTQAAVCAESLEDSVRATLMKLGQGLSTSDKTAAAQAFTDNAVFVDSDAKETVGRENILARLRANAAEKSGTTITLHPEIIRSTSPDSAWVLGSVSRDNNGTDTPSSRFTANLVNKNGNWLIETATETALKPSPTESLSELKWLEGKWICGDKKLSAAYLPGKAFLQLHLESAAAAAPETCIVGWDGAAKNFVSWQFNADGGFSSSVWTTRGSDWIIDSTGVSGDGDRTRALGVLIPTSADEFKWHTSRVSGSLFGGASNEPIVWRRDK